MAVSFTDLGIWVVCAYIVLEGLYHGKQLFFPKKEKTLSETTHANYKQRFVTREELNGQLDKLGQGVVKLTEKIDRVGNEVSALKAMVSWRNHDGG